MKILSLAQREIHLGLQSFVIQAPPVPLNTTVNTKFCLLFLIYCQWIQTTGDPNNIIIYIHVK